METRSSYIDFTPSEFHKYNNNNNNNVHSFGNGIVNHPRIIYESRTNDENEIRVNGKQQEQSEIVGHKIGNNQSTFDNGIQVENSDEKDKKKDKKWSFGGFFRRKCKKDADDSSEESEDENKRGFLSRRKSKRERRKVKAKSIANGFDVVIPLQKDSGLTNGIDTAAEQLWGATTKMTAAKTGENATSNGPIRFIHRHHNNALNPEASKSNRDSLQVPKQFRRDSNISRGSGGSDNVEGRKGRKEVLARAEAKRDMMRDDSSSDEYESYHSNSSLNRLNGDPSQREGLRRLRRVERHNKRLSKDDDNQMSQRDGDIRIIKSDLEGRRIPPHCRWVSRAYYPDSSDLEAMKFNMIYSSDTPSPTRSPRVRQKHLLQYMSMVQNSYPTSTFPPGIHYQQSQNVTPNHSPFSRIRKNAYAKENLHGSQPFINVPYRNQSYKSNRSSEYIHNLPRSLGSADGSTNRKSLMNYEQFLSSCETGKGKSLSYDQDIHRACYFENDPSDGTLSPNKINFSRVQMESLGGHLTSRRQNASEMPSNDARRSGMNSFISFQQTSRNFENDDGLVENRTDSTPSLSISSGNFPHHPTQIVQKSASGNSFCNYYENSNNFTQNRSNSYQHIPSYVNQNRGHHYGHFSGERPPTEIQRRNAINAQNGKQNGVTGIPYWSQSDTSQPTSPCTPDASKDNIYSNLPVLINKPPQKGSTSVQMELNSSPSILRYYADQNPRSRNPIHITCNPASSSSGLTSEQPYLSDSQVIVKTVQSRPGINASEFWKQKDQELMMKNSQAKKSDNLLKPVKMQSSTKSDRSRSSSPKRKEGTEPLVNSKLSQERSSCEFGRTSNGNVNQSDYFSCIEDKPVDTTNKKVLKEEFNVAKLNKTPPEPPIRRLSKQEVLARLHKCEQIQNEGSKNIKNEDKTHNTNLDDALNELEVIYNSLRLKDEDLAERADRRDLPVFRSSHSPKEYNSVSVRDKIENFYAETEFSHIHLPQSQNTSDGTMTTTGHQRPLPLRRSKIPDKLNDDMAFRRMNSKDRADVKKFPSQSYLRSSPALSPVPGGSPILRKETPLLEPDVTYDDVVFRNIRHANSTLKIQDPQPPFGIPIGVIAPAPNSDYLHAMPKERFRPTFTSSKTPDVVKDDLAFRNLRKDNKANVLPLTEAGKTDSNCLLKKRAVRSLSANLYNIMQKENSELPNVEDEGTKDNEKTQSLTDLSNGKWIGKKGLEKRLKELKEEKNAKRAEFFEFSQESRKRTVEKGDKNSSWEELINANGEFGNVADETTSSETLTGGSKGSNDRLSKRKIGFSDDAVRTAQTPEKKSFRSPVVELSKYPAAAPSTTIQGNPFKEPSLENSVDEDQLENLLSALAVEAKNASKDLERQLGQLETKKLPRAKNDISKTELFVEEKSKAIEEFNKKIETNSLGKNKRRRNLSLSNAYEPKEELRKTGSLERKKEKRQNTSTPLKKEDMFKFKDFFRKDDRTNEAKQSLKERQRNAATSPAFEEHSVNLSVTEVPLIVETVENCSEIEGKGSKTDSVRGVITTNDLGSREQRRSFSFEVVTDLSQILHDVEVEQQQWNEMSAEEVVKKKEISDSKDVFQEVYEYNCRLNNSERKRSQGNDDALDAFLKRVPDEKSGEEMDTVLSSEVEESNVLRIEGEVTSDIEEEFEKLHEEVNSSATRAKEVHGSDEFALVDDLLADITSVDQSTSGSYSSFPFPKDESGTSGCRSEQSFKSRDGSSPGSSKGEGNPHNPNDSLAENCRSNKVDIKKAEVLIEMFSTQRKEKEATPPNAKGMPTSNSSSESDRRRERIENYKDARRRELSTKYGSRHDTTTKSFKATRKKEDLRGGGTCDLLLPSYLNNQFPENQVPLSDSRRCLPRRDGNKTDSASGNNEETGLQETGNATSPKECILVRETRASRLRAASRTLTSDPGSPSSKPSKDGKKPEKDKTPFSGSPTYGSLTRKNIDKSHTRKSHLNRSHTSEGVYDDIYVLGDSNIRRRRGRNFSLESSPVKSDCEKCVLPLKTMGNSNGSLRETVASSERTHRTPQLSRNLLNSHKKSPNLSDRLSIKPLGNEDKTNKRGDEKKAESDFLRESSIQSKTQKIPTKGSSEHTFSSPQARLSSVENIPPRKSSDQSKNIDIATRAEILAASTLKMINRLDEINNKSKRTQVDSAKAHLEEASKKALPFNTVITNICRNNKVSENNAAIHKIEAKKVPVSDECAVKNASFSNRKNVRPKADASTKSPFVNMKTVKSETAKTESNFKGDTMGKPSILKNKSLGSSFANADPEKPKPVSILKRKSPSQDETQSSSFPVTFSPSVLKRESDGKRQGILKKRRSLDESEVQRRRSYSPDANYSDFKSILKNQRRSSMEELTRRSHSPDSTPQGILKRKSSKEEETEDSVSNEPQGILKRKSLPCLSSSHHVKTPESVVVAITAGIGDLHVNENVRPILKKKSSSEEHSASDISLTEVPKSILKKKTSLDVDEGEEKPKKPILKSSRMSSLEEPDDGKRCKSLTFNSVDAESVKPILKRENSRSKSAENENESAENGVVLRRIKSKRIERPHSSSDIDSELSAIFLKRRSLEFQPFSAMTLDWELQKPRMTSSNERLRGDALRRPLSVTEKINNLENFLEAERVERQRRNSPPGTPPDLKSSTFKFSPPIVSSAKSNLAFASTGTPSKPRLGETSTQENSELQTTSTFTYDGYSESPDHRALADEEIFGETPSLTTVSTYQKTSESDDGEFSFPPNINARKLSSDSIKDSESAKATNQLFSQTSFHSTDSEQVFSAKSSYKSDDRYDTDCFLSVDSCGEQISSLSLRDSSFGSCTDTMDEKDVQNLIHFQRSGSVSAKSLLFKESEKKCKSTQQDEKIIRKPLQESNKGIRRRNENKFLESNAQRFHTQPVSTEEVVAARKSRGATDDKGDEAEKHEDELSSMSYKDRLRLFELSFSPQTPESVSRKRGARFRTQPVTSVEVETAQSQRKPSSSSLTLSEQNKQDMDGMNPLDSETPKEKISDHISKNLNSKSSNLSEERKKPKGILKNFNQCEETFKKSSSDSESSDNEKRNYAKISLSESIRSTKTAVKNEEKESSAEVKGILKQASHYEKKLASSSEEESIVGRNASAKQGNSSLKANLAALLQKMEPISMDNVRKPKKDDSGENSIPLKGRDPGRRVQNEGIARRLSAKARNNSSVVKSQSHTSVSSGFLPSPNSTSLGTDRYRDLNGETKPINSINKETGSSSQAKDEPDESFNLQMGGLRRSTTQPLASSEGSADDDMSGATIQERLARLRRRGELDWQKRKSHVTNLEDELSVITAGNYLFNENCLIKEQNRASPPPISNAKDREESKSFSSILADRLGKLDAAKDGWKKRIKPSDAVRFSVEGKMSGKSESLSPPNVTLQISPTRTPVAERKKRSPKAIKFRSKQCNLSLSSVPSSPMEKINNPIARSVSAPGTGKDGLFSLSTTEEYNKANVPVVTVPRIDDETFTSFFNGICTETVFQERLDIKDEDLDVVTRIKSSQLLVQKRNIKTQRRRATVKNPVKALAARLSSQEYTEVKTGVAEKELKRMKIEKAFKNSNLAIEALAGLASQEDFTAINLKKASEGGMSSPDAPYKDLMLLHIKGRRHVQTRLIEPVAHNVNAGDCYVLIAPNRVFHYVGKFSNVIEKSRGAEISLHIQQKGDLGCTASSVITIGEGGRATKEQIKEFWQLLGGNPNSEREAGNVDEDELFESALVDTNMIYEVVNEELVPIETYWGSIPKIEVLDPNKILVFDFGSEFYVWNGKNVNLAQRKVAMNLAKELWEEGFDYTDCDLCPLTAAAHLGNRDAEREISESEKAGPVRPGWALFAKITQNMETVLFREKFLDWPDYSRVIRKTKKTEESDQGDSNAVIDVKPCDAKKMLENSVPEPDLVLEGSHLGRGTTYFDEETRRCSEITTRDVTVWHISEYDYSEVVPGAVGQFHMEDSYVVRWHYVITITGRELSGQPSKHLTTGRDRYAYFFWQGQDSAINDKGAAACLTVELDKEHGPHVRVVQGLEPPAFLNLFQGKMVVHKGKRSSGVSPNKWRFFIVRGETETESVLYEVPCSMRQLRSVASFVLVNRETGKIIVWHGWKALEHTRRIALSAAKHLKEEPSDDFEFLSKEISIREELEGSESHDFIKAVGGDNRQLYYSLLEHKTLEVKTSRLFHLTSVSGEFLFTEMSSPHLLKDHITPFPFLQGDLYSASQPALFLLDTGSCLWLWQGWWEDNSENDRGSGNIRFQAERRAAMSTALNYWTLKYGNGSPKAYLIWAGLEPLIFTNQFPFWNDRDDVAEINMRDGKKPGEAVLIKTELASLTQSTYPLAQLQNRPLPDGVNPTSLEDYLEPQCFQELFGVEKEEFVKMPSWKKKKLKQEAGLF